MPPGSSGWPWPCLGTGSPVNPRPHKRIMQTSGYRTMQNDVAHVHARVHACHAMHTRMPCITARLGTLGLGRRCPCNTHQGCVGIAHAPVGVGPLRVHLYCLLELDDGLYRAGSGGQATPSPSAAGRTLRCPLHSAAVARKAMTSTKWRPGCRLRPGSSSTSRPPACSAPAPASPRPIGPAPA